MTKHLTILGIATLCTIAVSAVVGVRMANAAAGDIYNLGTLGGTGSAAYDINDAGQVVGNTQDRAFLWDSNRGMTDLETANGYIHAYAINASGSVVGVRDDNGTGFPPHAYVWTPNEPHGTTGTMTNLAVPQADYSFALDINAAGLVVGESTYSYFVDDGSCTPDSPNYPDCGGGTWVTERRAVLWANGVGSKLTDRSDNEWAGAINNAGQVAGYTGWHAFRYDGTPGTGDMHDLGTLGGSFSAGRGINDSGQVVGDSSTAGDTANHAFRYTGTPGAGGVMIDLGTLGGAQSIALNINDAGFAVGQADRSASAGGGSYATLWRNDAGNTSVDLDAWLDAINPTVGSNWRLSEARAINNNGLITGTGYYDDGPGGLSDGSRAFVLDASSLVHPIPGDFNYNGIVDAVDYIVWRKTDGTSAEYNTWRTNFGLGFGTGSGAALPSAASLLAAVPEPTTEVLLLFAASGLCFGRRRSS